MITWFWTILLIALAWLSASQSTRVKIDWIRTTRNNFLVADRSVGIVLGAVTLAACWIQAPATLVSGIMAYQSGWHFAFFWLPNTLALIIPAFLVWRIRLTVPKGYTVPQYLGEIYGPSVRSIAFALQFASLVGAVGFTLTGIAQWLEPLIHVPSIWITAVLGAFAFIWVCWHGLPSALISDSVKIITVTTGVIAVLVLWIWTAPGSSLQTAVVVAAKPTTSIDPGIVFWMSLATGISLIGGPFANPDLGERNFALVKDQVLMRNAYLLAAVLFGIATLAFGSLGLYAREMIAEPIKGFPAFAVIAMFGTPAIIAASVGISLILMSALASYIASAAIWLLSKCSGE